MLPRGAGRRDATHQRTDRASVRTEHQLAAAGSGRARGAAQRSRCRPLPRARLPGGGTRRGTGSTPMPHTRDQAPQAHGRQRRRTSTHRQTQHGAQRRGNSRRSRGNPPPAPHHRRGTPLHRPARPAHKPRARALRPRPGSGRSTRARTTAHARSHQKTRRATPTPSHRHRNPKSINQPQSPPRPGMPALPLSPPTGKQPRSRRRNPPHPPRARGGPTRTPGRQGLLLQQAGKPGHPNAWWLTPQGEQIAQALEDRA